MTRYILYLEDLEMGVSEIGTSFDEECRGHEIVIDEKNIDAFLDEFTVDFKKMVKEKLVEEEE